MELGQIDESMLTGESLPIDKNTAVLPAETGPADRNNLAHAGTNVVRGSCIGVVVATGLHTRMGLIASGLSAASRATPLQVELASVTRRLGAAAIVIAGGVFAATLAIGENATVESAFLVAVALAVAACLAWTRNPPKPATRPR